MSTDVQTVIGTQYAAAMKGITAQLLSGSITMADWQAQMQDAIRASALQHAIADNGGALTSKQTAAVESQIAEQYSHLDTFAANIQKAAAEPGADLTEIADRAQVYAAPDGATADDTEIETPDIKISAKSNGATLGDLLATGMTLAVALAQQRAEQNAPQGQAQIATTSTVETPARDYVPPVDAPPEPPIGRVQMAANQDTADALTEEYKSQMFTLMGKLKSGEITVDEWHSGMQDIIRSSYLHQANAGKDGVVSEADYGAIEKAIEVQYGYLDGFAKDVQTAVEGDGDLGFMADRASMYAQSSESQYWDQALSDVDLPAIPRDSSTQCLSNCSCNWDLQHGDPGYINAFWQLGEADHCPDCVERSQTWNPLVIPLNSSGGN